MSLNIDSLPKLYFLQRTMIISYLIIYLFRVFHASVSWWFFTGVWATASLLKSPGLVSGFWPFFAMLSWIVSTRPPTSKSSRSFNNPLVIVPNAPITIGTIVTLVLHSFFQFSSKVEVLILLFTFLQIYSEVRNFRQFDNFADSLFLLIIMRSGLLAGIWWSVCILKSHRSICESFSRTGAGLCIYHLFVWSNWLDYYYYYYYYFSRVFHTSVSWCVFTGVWVSAILLKSPGLFSVLWPILTML